MRGATRNMRHLLVRSGSAPATNSSLDVSLLLSASDINQSTYICTALSHVQRLCTIRRTPTKPFKLFPVSVQTPQKMPTGNYRKSYLECQRPSISPFVTQILQRKVSELDLAHETHQREEGSCLFASRSCSRTFDIFGAAVEQRRRPDPSSVAKFVLLVVRPCKPPATFPGSSETPPHARAHTRQCTQSGATQTHACARCNSSAESRGGGEKKPSNKTLQPCSQSDSGAVSFKSKTYNTRSKVNVITCLYRSCWIFLHLFFFFYGLEVGAKIEEKQQFCRTVAL